MVSKALRPFGGAWVTPQGEPGQGSFSKWLLWVMVPLLSVAHCGKLWGTEPTAEEQIDFNRHIRPILAENCFFCHGPDKAERQAGLRLDLWEKATATLESGSRAIVPQEPQRSELLARVTSDDEFSVMPPPETGKKLSAEEIDLLRRWIKQGGEYADHWAYAPLKRPAVPQVEDEQWPLNPIDRFVLAGLARQGLSPSPEADRMTLSRRLSFDLAGLPPEKVLSDLSTTRYSQYVDELLQSPRYGERMAMYWLDLVRYADTVGYHGDQDHNISPYRDYVIKSFNENLPFDQFTIEQLAGDQLPHPSRSDPTQWQQIASGYNRLLQTSHEGGVQVKEYLAKYSADRVRNLSAVWMGATMGCAECHDHKYDPYTQKDFYSLAAFFADIDELGTFRGTNSLPTRRPPEIPVAGLPEKQEIDRLQDQLADITSELDLADEQGISRKRQQDLKQKQVQLRKQLQKVQKNLRVTMITNSIKPRTMRVLPRGNWLDDSGEIVQPDVPHFLPPLGKQNQPATRYDLANWLVRRDNPLTARVMVNRLWKLFYGRGLSSQLDDFGSQGEPPVDSDLLDWLAVEFIESGWDIKHLVRLMVTSRTYRQSSLASAELLQRDPQNRFLARQSRWRLDAEMVRDNALAVSGLLVHQLGGRSAKPYQPAGYYRHLNFPRRRYQHDSGPQQYRRGLYTHWQRVFLHPMLKAFDAPSREECTAQRPRSNTPLAALCLLNDPTFLEAARALAARIIHEGGPTFDARLTWAYQQVLNRPPSPREAAILKELYQQDLTDYQRDPQAAEALLSVGLSQPPADLSPAELAGWTGVARALLNLNETITRN